MRMVDAAGVVMRDRKCKDLQILEVALRSAEELQYS